MSLQVDRFAVPDNFQQLFGHAPELRNPRKDEDIRLNQSWRSPRVAVVRLASKF